MADQLVERIWPLPDQGTVVPVPAHPGRYRRRGINPATVLAQAFARSTAQPYSDCLRRLDHEPSQTGKNAAQRRSGPNFVVKVGGVRPQAGVVLLVDDVHTTGATLDACASALLEKTADRVIAISYARTL